MTSHRSAPSRSSRRTRFRRRGRVTEICLVCQNGPYSRRQFPRATGGSAERASGER
jgi:hypothetical protein